MRRKLCSWALAACFVAPMALGACGDDDDTPGGGAGRAGSGDAGDGNDAGRSGGGSGGAAGKGQGGSSVAGESQGGGSAGEESGGSGGEGAAPTGCDLSGADKEREDLPAEIEADLTLSNDKVWVINGTVWVRDGATLTIPPCTRIEGLSEPSPGFLAVLRGGRIEAEGTADEPILFTSSKEEGQRAPGDWGGVVLLGRAPITRPGGNTEAIYEGLTEEEYTYGGNDPEDDSGILRYVRIEFSGWEIFPDKEVNGLSMAGVGSGTTIDHVMINNTLDDCFEWWGGTVRADYLIANNCGDDHFDGDEGWQGGGQYWFGRTNSDFVDSDDANGFELDSINDGTTPRTAFSFQDVTLCGTGEESGRPGPHYGMVLRELVTGSIDNLALVGFEYGIDTRDAFAEGDVTISNSKIWGLVKDLGAPDSNDNDSGFPDASIFEDGEDNELDPDPAPFTTEQCLAADGPTAEVTGSELGAFVDGAEWFDGLWIDWAEN